jgi:hypothetical protein
MGEWPSPGFLKVLNSTVNKGRFRENFVKDRIHTPRKPGGISLQHVLSIKDSPKQTVQSGGSLLDSSLRTVHFGLVHIR